MARDECAVGRGKTIRAMAALLVLKVTVGIVMKYRDYFPPDFDSEFLYGREGYFFGWYRCAFYAHIAAGPIALILGTMLLSETLRRLRPGLHRRLGRIQAGLVLALVVPSGLAMASRAAAGQIAGAGLATLAVLTGLCVIQGWRAAAERRFGAHRVWMWRTYLMLASAVVLRLAAGAASFAGFAPPWFDPLANWASWLLPLGVYEGLRMRPARAFRPPLS